MLTSAAVKARAAGLGFDLCAVAPVAPFEELSFLRTWIAKRYYGTMSWIPRTARVRGDVRQIVPGAQSVVVTGTLYNTAQPRSAHAEDPARALVSRYAQGEDYHAVIGQRLDDLLGWMREAHTEPFEARRYVDTGPVQERVYARHAGLGWIGKNTCLINPRLGSWLFLGEIICTLPLEPDPPGVDQCGSCQACLQSCPTGALVEPGVLDARRCISYLTIEKRGSMPEPLRAEVGRHVYGCDICQEVCPWNARPVASARPEWQPQPALAAPTLAALWLASDAALERIRAHGPMTRASVVTLRRNLAVAIGNAGDAVPDHVLDERTSDLAERPSLGDPAVVEAIAWSRARRAGGSHVADDGAPPRFGAPGLSEVV